MHESKDAIKERALALLESQTAFLNELIAVRKQQGLTQEEVSQRMGISQSAVAQFERYDANPSLGTIRRYALAVGANIEMEVSSPQTFSTTRFGLQSPDAAVNNFYEDSLDQDGQDEVNWEDVRMEISHA